MPGKLLGDPAGVANGVVADYTTYLASNGAQIEYASDTESWLASGTILQGDAVYVVAPTTTSPVRVASLPPDSAGGVLLRFRGIAKEAASNGDIVRVQTNGIALANVSVSVTKGTGNIGAFTGVAPALGNVAVNPAAASNSAGQLTSYAPPLVADQVAGQAFGVFLGAASGGKAPLLIKQF